MEGTSRGSQDGADGLEGAFSLSERRAVKKGKRGTQFGQGRPPHRARIAFVASSCPLNKGKRY